MSTSNESPSVKLRAGRLLIPRLGSIRNRIVAFAIIATLVPSGITMGISYTRGRRALEEKLAQDLHSASAQTSRAMGVWLKERLYDLRVFASSEEVANNLGAGLGGLPNRGRLNDYLLSLHERFGDFDQLMVLDLAGNVVGSSARGDKPSPFPSAQLKTLKAQGQLIGDPYWDATAGKAKLAVAVPIQRADGRLIGGFAAAVNLTPMRELLREFAHDSSSTIHLMSTSGSLIASTDSVTRRLMLAKLPAATLGRLRSRETGLLPFRNITGRQVVGTLEAVPQTPWMIVSEMPADEAFEQVRRSRNASLLIVVVLLVAVVASGYRFGRLIARPLERLTQAAAEVASGDLAVDLPEGGSGEVGSLTVVFNHMVLRLREGRHKLDEINEQLRAQNEELERLSTTDGLTGLANRRFLTQRLEEERIRAARSNRVFSVLMADVDHFKEYNDTFGHPAGDEVLKKVAAILREATREMDCTARYGGEEFAVVLPETNIAGAIAVAERIREHTAREQFPGRQITLSIGVAEFPEHGDAPQAVVAAADRALYQAKGDGRDRVVQARKAVLASK